MTDTTITDAVVWPQDGGPNAGDGTGLPDANDDWNSAGYFSALAQYKGYGSYVGEDETGSATLQFANVDTTNETVDVEAGHAFILDGNHTVQGGSQNSYNTTLPFQVPYVVVLPTNETGLSLGADTGNDIWLAVDPTTNDDVYIRHGSGLTAPSDPSVKLGTVNSSTGAITRPNDLSSIRAKALTVISSITDAAGVSHGSELADLSDTFSGSHDDLTNVSASDHHTKYTDGEAQSAINNDADHGSTAPHNYFSGSHNDLSNVSINDHHARDHALRHHDGGADEIDAASLSGASGSSGQVLTTNGSAASWSDPSSGSDISHTFLDSSTDSNIGTEFDATLSLGGGYDYYVIDVDLIPGNNNSVGSLTATVNSITSSSYDYRTQSNGQSSGASSFLLADDIGNGSFYAGPVSGKYLLRTYNDGSSWVHLPSGELSVRYNSDSISYGVIRSTESDISGTHVQTSSGNYMIGTVKGYGVTLS